MLKGSRGVGGTRGYVPRQLRRTLRGLAVVGVAALVALRRNWLVPWRWWLAAALVAIAVEWGIGRREEHHRAHQRGLIRARYRAERRYGGAFVYFVQRADGLVKIGFSKRPATRLVDLQGIYGPLQLLGVQMGGWLEEQELHQRFARSRVYGEWFRPVPRLVRYAEGCRCLTPSVRAVAEQLAADFAANAYRVQRMTRMTWPHAREEKP